MLWLHGRPGCGKTNLVAVVLERLKRQRDLGALAYFYCSRDTAEEKRSQPHEVLRSLIRQLAFESSPSSQLRPAAALKYQEKEGQAKENRAEEVETLSWDDCLSLIVELLRGYKTTVVIDALDELKREDRWMMYEAFQNIIEELPDGVVRLFISSRDDMDIKLELKRYANIHVKATDNTDDIFRFIDHEVDHAIKRRKFLSGREIPKDLSEDLTTTLRAKACGMYVKNEPSCHVIY